MKMKRIVLICILGLASWFISGQDITGQWKTIDDESGKVRSIVEVFEDNGKFYGKIIKISNPEKRDALCKDCEGDKKDQPIQGMQIISELSKNEDVYDGGTILNPTNGKVYKCRLKLEDSNTLQVRGYVAFFYKTQYWKRVQ